MPCCGPVLPRSRQVSVPPAKRVACWVGPSQRRQLSVKTALIAQPLLVHGGSALPLPARSRPGTRHRPVPRNAPPCRSSASRPTTAQAPPHSAPSSTLALRPRQAWAGSPPTGGRAPAAAAPPRADPPSGGPTRASSRPRSHGARRRGLCVATAEGTPPDTCIPSARAPSSATGFPSYSPPAGMPASHPGRTVLPQRSKLFKSH